MAMKSMRQDDFDRLREAEDALKKGVFSDVYLVCGSEQYLVKILSRHIAVTLREKFGIKDTEVILADRSFIMNDLEAKTNAITASLATAGTLFDQQEKIVWIKLGDRLFKGRRGRHDADADADAGDHADDDDDAPGRKAAGATFTAYAASVAAAIEKLERGRTYLIFTLYGEPATGSALYKCIEKRGTVVWFEGFRGYAAEKKRIYDYLGATILKACRKRLGPEAFELLIGYVGCDLQMLMNELEKLILYIGGRPEIVADDIRALLDMTKESAIFDIQDSFGERDRLGYARHLTLMRDAGVYMPLIVGGLAGRVRQLKAMQGVVRKEALDLRRFARLAYYDRNPIIKAMKERYQAEDPSAAGAVEPAVREIMMKPAPVIERLILQSARYTARELDALLEALLRIDLGLKRSDPAAVERLYTLIAR